MCSFSTRPTSVYHFVGLLLVEVGSAPSSWKGLTSGQGKLSVQCMIKCRPAGASSGVDDAAAPEALAAMPFAYARFRAPFLEFPYCGK